MRPGGEGPCKPLLQGSRSRPVGPHDQTAPPCTGESGRGAGEPENCAQPHVVTRGLPHSQSQQVQ